MVLLPVLPVGAVDTSSATGYSSAAVVKKDTAGITNIKDFDTASDKKEYVVSDLEGLNKLVSIVNTSKKTLEGVTIYQIANISGKGLGTDGADATFAGIGKDSNTTFSGTFDGQGYIINNLVISGTTPAGFFITSNGTIRNVVLGDGILVKGKGKVGGLIGEIRTRTGTTVLVENCYVAATVEASTSGAGGVIGQIDWDTQKGATPSKVIMKNITFNGKLTVVGGRCGGLLGRAAECDLEIDRCVVAGTLYAGTADAPAQTAEIYTQKVGSKDIKKVSSCAGFVGETTRGADRNLIKNSINLANVTSGYAGVAFLGSLPVNAGATIENCTNYGTVTSKVPSGTVIQVADKDADGNAIKADIEMKYHSALVGYVFNTGSNLVIDAASTDKAGQTPPAFETVNFKPAVMVVGGYSAAAVVKKDTAGITDIKDYDSTNKKTEYVVSDMAGLQTLAYVVSTGDTLEGVTVYQTANIIGGGVEDATSNFPGIGKDSNKIFSGTFDGQGYVIDNFLINGATPSGLFITANGTIRNVVLGDKLVIKGKGKVGGLIGEIRTRTGTTVLVENCYVAATVEASTSGAGGVIGQIDWDTQKGATPSKVIMKNITFNGKMTAVGGRCGGLLGRAAECDLEIDSCVVAGTLYAGTADAPAKAAEIYAKKVGSQDIKKVSSCAGFVGETTRGADRNLIKDSVNLATVTSGYAGVAFLGSLPVNAGATIQNCYNFGTVSSAVPSGTPIKVADQDKDGNAIQVDILMKYHSALVGYIFNTGANLVIDSDSADKAGEKAPDFEKVDFSAIVPPAVEDTTPEVTTPEVTTPEETTTEEATTPEVTTEADTTAKETTAADTTAKAPEETTGTDAGADEKGCGSVVGGTIALIIAVAGGAMLITRKKED